MHQLPLSGSLHAPWTSVLFARLALRGISCCHPAPGTLQRVRFYSPGLLCAASTAAVRLFACSLEVDVFVSSLSSIVAYVELGKEKHTSRASLFPASGSHPAQGTNSVRTSWHYAIGIALFHGIMPLALHYLMALCHSHCIISWHYGIGIALSHGIMPLAYVELGKEKHTSKASLFPACDPHPVQGTNSVRTPWHTLSWSKKNTHPKPALPCSWLKPCPGHFFCQGVELGLLSHFKALGRPHRP